MKIKKTWPFPIAFVVLVITAILTGIATGNGTDLSIITGFSSIGAVVCAVLFIGFTLQNQKLKKTYKKVEVSSSTGSSIKAEIYVPDIVSEFDNAVRLHFPQLPFEEYHVPSELYSALEEDVKKGRPTTQLLQKILMDMEHHLKLKLKDVSIITMERITDSRAGYIEKSSYSFSEITVGYKEIYNADCYLAILAHELSHSYQFSLDKQHIFDKDKIELFTDALTFYLGFGKLTEKGKKVSKTEIVEMTGNGTKYWTETVTLGYLEAENFPYLHTMVEELRRQRKEQKETVELNKKIIQEIKNLLDAIGIYVSSITDLVDALKTKKITQEDLVIIREAIVMFDSEFLNRLKTKMGNYPKGKLADNQTKLSALKNAMADVMKYSKLLTEMVKNY